MEVLDYCRGLRQLCDKEQLDIDHKLVAFGNDGGAVMTGLCGCVAALLKARLLWIIANRCIAHRLALAAGQAANEIPYVKKFKTILDQLYRFYENSAVCTAGLKGIQDVLNDPRMKLTQAKDVRWLSHDRAVGNLGDAFLGNHKLGTRGFRTP